jgi:hypothetical protein
MVQQFIEAPNICFYAQKAGYYIMISLRRVLWTLAGMSILTSAANAQTVLYNNLGTPGNLVTPSGFASIYNAGPLANSFSTGSSPILLTDVKLNLDLIDTPPRGSISVALYSDSSHFPNALLTTIGTLNDSQLTLSVGNVFDFPVSPGYSLTANTRYWIVVTSVNTTLGGWGYVTNTNGTGNIGNEYNCYTGDPCFPNGSPYMMEVSGSSPGVPTLSTWGLLCLALLLMASAGWIFRRGYRSHS